MSLQSPQILNIVDAEQADRFFWMFIFLLSGKTRVVAAYHCQECVSEASLCASWYKLLNLCKYDPASVKRAQ